MRRWKRRADIATFEDLVREAGRRLRDAGIDEAGANARQLMLHVTAGTPAFFVAQAREPVPQETAEAFLAAVARRAGRVPLQHITGRTPFYGLEILTDPRALVPRPDSECVVSAALALVDRDRPVRFADLGTGSGCLLAALLAQCPQATGIGVEASPEAACLARENIQALGLGGRATIVTQSWGAWTGWHLADLIISNPPYIASDVIAALEPEVRDHDPRSALDAGPDGLSAYREITALAARRMRPGSCLVLETGFDQRQKVTGLLDLAGFTNLSSGQDLGGQDRWVAGRKA